MNLKAIAASVRVVDFVCSRCEHRGQYDVSLLLARFGDVSFNAVLDLIAGDCPRRGSSNFYDRCSIHSPTVLQLLIDENARKERLAGGGPSE